MRQSVFVIATSLIITACNSPKTNESQNTSSTKVDSSAEVSAAGSYSNNSCPELYQKAKSMDSTILNQLEMNVDMANKAIKLFTDYAFYCESDSLSPIFLIKTAQIATSINNPNQAKVALDRVLSNYPKFKNRPAAMFLLAQLYDEQTQLNNEEEAGKLYNKIIEEYPKTEWALNAKAALQLLGKSDLEIVNEFNKKNKKGGK